MQFGGEIKYKDTPGGGSTFYFRILLENNSKIEKSKVIMTQDKMDK
jgi:hypothetical protein